VVVTLLVAHGSRNPRAAEEHARLCAEVSSRAGGVEVRPAYLEITEPSIPDAIDAAVADGATVVRLLPHFLGSGNHVLVDLPAIADTARQRHPQVRIDLLEHLGADPRLAQLLAEKAADG